MHPLSYQLRGETVPSGPHRFQDEDMSPTRLIHLEELRPHCAPGTASALETSVGGMERGVLSPGRDPKNQDSVAFD